MVKPARPASHLQLIVKDAEPSGSIPLGIRLRAWLKQGLRRFGIRCLEIREVARDVPPAPQPGEKS